MANFIINRIKALVYVVIGLFRRALCCIRRRRRQSFDSVTLTAVGVVSDKEKPIEQQWTTWEEPQTVVTGHSQPNSIQQQIDLYRQHRTMSQSEEEPPPINYFEDMTPKITRQTKILLQDKRSDNRGNMNSSKFSHDPVYNSSELGSWEDGQGWEDETQKDWDVDSVLREKKRLDRERKLQEQQRKKLEREYQTKKQLIGVRLS